MARSSVIAIRTRRLCDGSAYPMRSEVVQRADVGSKPHLSAPPKNVDPLVDKCGFFFQEDSNMAPPIKGKQLIQDTSGTFTRIILDGDTASIAAGGEQKNGALVLKDSADNVKVRIGLISGIGGKGGKGLPPPEWGVVVRAADGTEVVRLGPNGDLRLGGEGLDGDLILTDAAGNVRIRIGGADHRIVLKDEAGVDRIVLDGDTGVGIKSDADNPALRAEAEGLGDGVVGVAAATVRSGVYGVSSSEGGYGVFGRNTAPRGQPVGALGVGGVAGEAYTAVGVYGETFYADGLDTGIYGRGSTGVTGISTYPVSGNEQGSGAGVTGMGIHQPGITGSTDEMSAVFGLNRNTDREDVWAGEFTGIIPSGGRVRVEGDLVCEGNKCFRIDHPLDPANKYLVHCSVESSERLNVYSGNVVLDASGEAWVELPGWGMAVNGDFRYQLTAVGGPMPNLHVAREVSENRFKIAGGTPGAGVSWQVVGTRQDAYAKAHPLRVEVEKPARERGTFLHPFELGFPEEARLNYARMRALNERVESMRRGRVGSARGDAEDSKREGV